jgi:hypothetical protein
MRGEIQKIPGADVVILAIDLGNCLAFKNVGGLLEVWMRVRR